MNNPEKFWDRMAGSYDSGEGLSEGELELIENVRRQLRADDRVLDYGCATGNITFRIADHVRQVQGIDISGDMIAAAEEKAAGRGVKNVAFTQATIGDARLEAGSFDAVLALNILHLLPDVEQALKRIHALLATGGRLVSSTACMGENRWAFTSLALRVAKTLRIVPPVHFFKATELEGIIQQANFELIEMESQVDPESKTKVHFVTGRKL